MEADHHQATAHFQALQRGFEAGFQITQFVVDVDTQPLERAGCGVLALFPGWVGDFQDFCQVTGALEWLDVATFGHSTGHAAGETLFAVFLEHPGDFFHGRGVDEFGGADATGRIHAHVQRTVVEEAEAALRVVELWRGHAKIQQHAADLAGQTAFGDFRTELGKAALHNDKAAVFGR
ncbi:hypothetical protein D3C75_992270 [compost metagenome]